MIRDVKDLENEFGPPIPTISDVFIHFLFGSPQYAPALVHFVNAVLTDAKLAPITKATIKNPFNPHSYQFEKDIVLDILAEDENSRLYDFEVQVASHKYFVERCLYYWAKTFSQQLTEGEFYIKLKPVVSVILTDFQAVKDLDSLHSSFGILSKTDEKILLTHHFDMHFLRVPETINSETLRQTSSPLKEWLAFFGYPKKTTEAEMKEASQKDPGVQMAYDAYQKFNRAPDLREIAERREKFLRDIQARLETLSDEKWAAGKAEGLAEGLEKGQREGKLEQALVTLHQIIEWNLGELSEELRDRILRLNDLEKINQIYEKVARRQIETLEEFEELL